MNPASMNPKLAPHISEVDLRVKIDEALEPLMIAVGESKDERRGDTQSFVDDAIDRLQALLDQNTQAVLAELEAQQIPVVALTAKKPHTEVQIQAIPVEAVRETIKAVRGQK